ncbi:MAG: o-succinylbenzoate synthase [Cytophagaceae bacterium]|jgi:o-succinylbenzoate synthase|nr:o-succinylbenzoate synthase [Cytophagaceae bacterium]
MLQASIQKHQLIFKEPGGTSRGVLTTKKSCYIRVWDSESPSVCGIGECSVLPNLSPDDSPELDEKLAWCCENINRLHNSFHSVLHNLPAIRFALEMAFIDLKNGGCQILFPSDFTDGKWGIPINGLIWMGKPDEMNRRISEKLEAGFNCLKLKIGVLNFDDEYAILTRLRNRFSSEALEIRVDANGAFLPDKVPALLDKLAQLKIHSIEQPIRAGQWEVMQRLCQQTPVPIALDEELISINNIKLREEMLAFVRPQYIILKPSLTGGFQSSEEWIAIAQNNNCKWWITSALEGNIGLNAIAQWTATFGVNMPQGLGTGQVFANNTESHLEIRNGFLYHLSKQ